MKGGEAEYFRNIVGKGDFGSGRQSDFKQIFEHRVLGANMIV